MSVWAPRSEGKRLTGMQSLNGLVEDGFRAEGALTCGAFTGISALASRLLALWFGDFWDVCAWNSRVF